MSAEMRWQDLDQAFITVDAAFEDLSLVQDRMRRVREHIEWLEEQVADRDETILRMADDAESLRSEIRELARQIGDWRAVQPLD